jgi:Major Facilitator Superfamily
VKPVLRIPAYRRLLAAYALNELAFTIGSLALALVVYRRTGSAFGATAFFLISQFAPALISPMVVARLDQLPSRPVLSALYWLEAVVFAALAWVTDGHFTLVSVLALALLDGVAAMTARALARAATVTVTSAAGLLREGNAVANAGFSVCFMLGPGVGGAVVATGGTSAALLAVGALFGLIGVTLATATGLPEAAPIRTSAKGRVRAALAYARERPAIRSLVIVQAIGVLFFTISVPVEVVFAQHTLHAGAAGYGALLSAWGAGAVAGAAIYARWRALPSRNLITIGAGSLGIGFVVMAVAPTLAVAIAGGAFAGIGNGVENVAARTALQEEVEERWMALMMSLNEALFQSVPGVGILLGGTITAIGSARAALAVASAGSFAITAMAWLALAGLGSRPEPEPEPDPDPEPKPEPGPRGEPEAAPVAPGPEADPVGPGAQPDPAGAGPQSDPVGAGP